MDSAKNFVYAMHKPISNSLSNSSLSPTPTLHFTLPSTSDSSLQLLSPPKGLILLQNRHRI